ncbi:hypothetical protein Tco_1284833 [Tanacetum coccineum]
MKPPRRLLKLPLKPQIESPTTSVVRPPRPTPTKKGFQNLRYEVGNLLTELESDYSIGYIEHGYKIRKNQNQTLLISTSDLERVPPQNADLLTSEGKFISRISVGHPSTISRRAASLKTFSMLPRFLFPIFTSAKVIVGGIFTPKVLPLIASQVLAFASPSTQFVIGTRLLTMSVLVDACSLAFDPHASTLTFDPHASTLALEDASDACALANIHALAFSISFQESFTSLLLHPE